MPVLLLYILKLSCSLCIVWLFYRLLLHNLTFYNSNRWYLLGYALLSFLIPFINIGPIDREDPALQPLIIQYIPVIGEGQPAKASPSPVHSLAWTWPDTVLLLIALGAAFLLIRLAIRFLSLRRMRQNAELLESGRIKIYGVREKISPFSFGNAIYINTSQHTQKEQEEIILHEYAHIRQHHTVDILVAEIITILNWYNPFAWLIRYSIRQNLEFIADRKVVENGFDKKDYQYHLLRVVGQAQYRLANNFNFSSLKKRIVMMNKLKSARLHLVKFLFILPLLAVLLVAFRDRYTGLWHHQHGTPVVNIAGIIFDLDSHAPIVGVIVKEEATGLETRTDDRGFFKISIPVTTDSARISVNFTKPGYDTSFYGYGQNHPTLKGPTGLVWAIPMWTPVHKHLRVFMSVPFGGRLPEDPGYEDAVKELKAQIKWNEDYQRLSDMKKDHPEVSLFYTTEDDQKHLVFHKDGVVERYGYLGGATVADMERKYGKLSDLMKPPTLADPRHLASPGYLARWAEISAQAEKEFRATGGSPLAIVFPGDSRVIAVAADGQARIYDMDNDDPKERPAFEKTYGRLPDCVPAGFHYNYQHPGGALPASASLSGGETDTSAPKHDSAKSMTIAVHRDTSKPMVLTGLSHNYRDLTRDPNLALYIVDGVIKGHGFKDSVPKNEIESIEVLKDEEAVRLFGAEGAYGVVAIITKGHGGRTSLDSMLGDIYHIRKGQPLIVIDGVPAPGNNLQLVRPEDIESINVLMEAASKALYGEKAQYGALLITTKKKARPQVVVEGMYDGQKVTIQADSIVTPQGKIHAVEPAAKP